MSVRRPLYERPVARGISGSSAVGQEPLGWCVSGTAITVQTCANGFRPTGTVASCLPVGSVPEAGNCIVGNLVSWGCASGGTFS